VQCVPGDSTLVVMSVNDLEFSRRLAAGVLLLDGAMASELERLGWPVDGDPLWSARALLEAPQLVRQVHRAYLEAGADVITSAGYQVSFEGFEAQGLGREAAEECLLLATRLALEERDRFVAEHRLCDRPLVAASMGPWGAVLADGSEYRGDYRVGVEALADFHLRRLEVVVRGAPDILAFETFPSGPEAEALARVLEQMPDTECWVSFSCPTGVLLADGSALDRAMGDLVELPAVVAVGVNCCPPGRITPLLRSVQGIDLPKVAYPNSGELRHASSGSWGQASKDPEPMTRSLERWSNLGARLIGGCCRTGPALTRRLRDVLGPR